MSGDRIDVTAKPGLVLLDVVVGPLSVQVAIRPRDADTLAGAFQRAAIEANAPKRALVTPAPLPANEDRPLRDLGES